MKTDPKNNNASRAPSHPELTATDNNPRKLYEVTVHSTEYRYLTIRVHAKSEAAAERSAERIAGLRGDSAWNVADRDLYAYEVNQVEEGGSHE
jgi:hypothetical protein